MPILDEIDGLIQSPDYVEPNSIIARLPEGVSASDLQAYMNSLAGDETGAT